ncbi:Septin [Piptocephalis cylindrospora]|uniref:Septin n=1 Tax=Piptocephalis cylindrospora TaxID=1907219 RepID=A0A4P9Y5A3_9FUNG|nr:Septin [Piptocephalis cylindrospora]|eukprot:RKP14115.1 Septin [Piptocephalis cylindrospora]
MAPSKDIGIADLPNQRHKIETKKGANFTVMVVGESGLGKTTFINTLFTTTIVEHKDHRRRFQKQLEKTTDIQITKADLQEKMFQMRLNIVDTPGFGDYVDNRDASLPIVDFIDSQYESYLRQEQQPTREGKVDMRVHACLYFIRPTGHGLKSLDVEVMKQLGSRCNLIPVIGKADTLCAADLLAFKKTIRSQIQEHEIQVYDVSARTSPKEEGDSDSEDEDEARTPEDATPSLTRIMPFSIVGSDRDVRTSDGRVVKGREYPWGVVEVENEEHCDFILLRDLLIRTHMLDLITSTEEVHYDSYRSKHLAGTLPTTKASQLTSKFKEEEETLRRRFTEQVKLEENRFRQWESRLISERDRLNKDLETEHSYVKALEADLEAYSKQYRK